jgi:hypothetical protein
MSLVGAEGTATAGDVQTLGTVPNLTFDTFEEDPDTSAALTPASILLGKVKIERSA